MPGPLYFPYVYRGKGGDGCLYFHRPTVVRCCNHFDQKRRGMHGGASKAFYFFLSGGPNQPASRARRSSRGASVSLIGRLLT